MLNRLDVKSYMDRFELDLWSSIKFCFYISIDDFFVALN